MIEDVDIQQYVGLIEANPQLVVHRTPSLRR